jgi:hypothetical protein
VAEPVRWPARPVLIGPAVRGQRRGPRWTPLSRPARRCPTGSTPRHWHWSCALVPARRAVVTAALRCSAGGAAVLVRASGCRRRAAVWLSYGDLGVVADAAKAFILPA